MEKHPNPYSLGWIRLAVGKIEVTERCKVPFSTGKYHDVVYCDVLDMDVCHLLFGRPWQYDVNALYAGRENVYKFEKDGVRFTLLPLKQKEHSKAAREKGCLLLTIT